MKRSIALSIATAVAALATGASAQYAHSQPRVYAEPAVRIYEGPRTYAYGEIGPEFHRSNCDAPRWEPNRRYLPGQTVRREGKLYTATDVSAQVYNVNSPPEWTPNYWVRARCR